MWQTFQGGQLWRPNKWKEPHISSLYSGPVWQVQVQNSPPLCYRTGADQVSHDQPAGPPFSVAQDHETVVDRPHKISTGDELVRYHEWSSTFLVVGIKPAPSHHVHISDGWSEQEVQRLVNLTEVSRDVSRHLKQAHSWCGHQHVKSHQQQ